MPGCFGIISQILELLDTASLDDSNSEMEVLQETPVASSVWGGKGAAAILGSWTDSEGDAGLECSRYEDVATNELDDGLIFVFLPSDGCVKRPIPPSQENCDAVETTKKRDGHLPANQEPCPRRSVLQSTGSKLFPRRVWKYKRARPNRRQLKCSGFAIIRRLVGNKSSTSTNDNDIETMSVASTAAETVESDSSSYGQVFDNTSDEGGSKEIMDIDSVLLELIRVFVEYKSEEVAQAYAEVETTLTRPSLEEKEQCPYTPPTTDEDDEEHDQHEEVTLIERRLLRTGVCHSKKDFEFVTDKVSKEVAHLYAHEAEKEVEDEESSLAHVKTGVWEVITFDKETGTANEPFYVVTGVSMEDRVDTKKLRKLLFRGQQQKKRPKLHFAPTPIGEALTGYKSGTMAPICHATDMKLFLEESILPCDKKLKEGFRIVCGSGMFGKCLSLPADTFVQIAKQNPKGFEIASLIQKKRKAAPKAE